MRIFSGKNTGILYAERFSDSARENKTLPFYKLNTPVNMSNSAQQQAWERHPLPEKSFCLQSVQSVEVWLIFARIRRTFYQAHSIKLTKNERTPSYNGDN